MTVVILIAVGYVAVLIFTVALLTAAKRGDEAIEREAPDALARHDRVIPLDSVRFSRTTDEAKRRLRSPAGRRP